MSEDADRKRSSMKIPLLLFSETGSKVIREKKRQGINVQSCSKVLTQRLSGKGKAETTKMSGVQQMEELIQGSQSHT